LQARGLTRYSYPGDIRVHTKFGSANKRNCALPIIPQLFSTPVSKSESLPCSFSVHFQARDVYELALPALPFTIMMPALSLLLVFRTNTAYARWNEARTLWGGVVNSCRNVVRQSNTFFPVYIYIYTYIHIYIYIYIYIYPPTRVGTRRARSGEESLIRAETSSANPTPSSRYAFVLILIDRELRSK